MKYFTYIAALLVMTLTLNADAFEEAVASYSKGNYVQALNSFYTLAKSGDTDAQYNVGLIYANGKGVKVDMEQAMEWYEKAANSGHGMAAYNLGEIYYNLEDKNPKRYENALKWYEVAAGKQVAQAYNNLGAMYMQGIGVKQNRKKAFVNFKKAAEAGSPAGQLNLALLYGWGPNIIRDEPKAYRFMTKALEGGRTEAKAYIEKLCKEKPEACKK